MSGNLGGYFLSAVVFVAGWVMPCVSTASEKSDDNLVIERVHELGEQIAKGFSKLKDKGKFRTVAVLYFADEDQASKDKKMGRLVGELLAADLAARPDFLVVERERLKKIINELKFAESGFVDEDSAAQLGNFLGCQAIVMGSVMAAGSDFVVSAKQVAVETAQVLVATQVKIPREGLIALSEKAIVTRTVGGAVLRSVLVPGWGQIYNQQTTKGVLFIGAAASVLAGAAAGLSMRMYYGVQYKDATDPDDVKDLRDKGNGAALAANILAGVYGVVWIISVLDAWLSGGDYEGIDLDRAGAAGVAPAVTSGGGVGVTYGLTF